jgi:hypothetical protein
LSDSDPESSSDDDGCLSDDEQGRTRKRASLGSGYLANSLAGLRPQYARAGPWYSAESNKLPPTGGQAAAQALCAYLSLGIYWDECLEEDLVFLSQSVESRGAQKKMKRTSEADMRLNVFIENN